MSITALYDGAVLPLADDDPVELGPAKLLWETKDPNANALLLVLPEGGSVDVPVFVIGDESIEDQDLGWFNGVTQPSLVLVDADKDSYIRFSFLSDDNPYILPGGSASKIHFKQLVSIHDGTEPSWGHSPAGLAVKGVAEFDGNVFMDGTLYIDRAGTATYVELGHDTADHVIIDFHGSSTYTDYGARLQRYNAGDNAIFEILNRGTGGIKVSAVEAGTVTLATTNVARLIVSSAGLVQSITGGTTPTWGHSPTGLAVEGISEFDGRAYFDAQLDVYGELASHSTFRLHSDQVFRIGSSGYGGMLYETADENANSVFLALGAGAANNVPVLVIGDNSIEGQDLGWFNGIVEPTVALVDGDKDSYVAWGWSADDTPELRLGGNAIAILLNGFKLVLEHHTADDTLTRAESGSVHTNLGEDGAMTLTLPQDATVGCVFDFVVMTAQELRVDPGAAGAIYINGAKQTDDKYITANDEAESVRLVADGNGDWVAISTVGTWGVEA